MPTGVTLLEGSEAGPVPTALVAVTVKVYGWPLTRLVTLQVLFTCVVHCLEPGELVTV
jgi:hypothetical protein